jgi:hypothetical protein
VLFSLRTIFALLIFYALAEFFVILAGLLRNSRAIRGPSTERASMETREETPSMVTDRAGVHSASD